MKPSLWPEKINRFFHSICIIEILVVFAIISILAAMLIPTLIKAKQRDEQRKAQKTQSVQLENGQIVKVTGDVTSVIQVGDTITIAGLDRKGIVNYISDTGFVDVLVEGTNGGAPNLLKGVNPKLIRK